MSLEMLHRGHFAALAIALSLVITVGFSTSALAQVMLSADGQVDGETVTLGHLFAGLPADKAATPIARAPEPWGQAIVTYQTLYRIAQTHGVDWRPTSRLDRVRLQRPGQSVDADHLTLAVAAEIARQDLLADPLVQMAPVRDLPVLPLGASPTLAVDGLSFDRASGRFTATLRINAEGVAAAPLAISGRAFDQVTIPVATRALPQGHVIADGDLGWTTLRADRLPRGWVDDPARLLGMQVLQTVRPEVPIRARQVAPPVVIARGATVTLVLNQPPLLLTAKARALEDGALGEVIRFENSSSGRTVDARIHAPDLAQVISGSDLAVAARLNGARP